MIERTGESLYLSQARSNDPASGALGKDDFLQLLVAQLQNQSPLNPMEDRQFISQMATFASLEQMTNLNEAMNRFLETQQASSWLDDTALIGKQVTWRPDGEETEAMESVVRSVLFKNGHVQFETEDGDIIGKEQVLAIGLPDSNRGET